MSYLRSIHTLAKTVWKLPRLKARFDQQIWAIARQHDFVANAEPVVDFGGVCPARLHADFSRMLDGVGPAFNETSTAISNLRTEVNRLGFVANPRNRYSSSSELGLSGNVDAHGHIDGYPTILELKVVRFLPQIVRAADSAQLLLYDLARNGTIGSTLLVALYIQPQGTFRAATRFVFEPKTLEPLVRELAA